MRVGLRNLSRNAEILPGLILLILLIAPYWFTIPVWDGQAFQECVRGAAHETFQWQYFLCYAHPTIFFISLFAIPEYFVPNSMFLLHTLMFALGIASVIAFYALCRFFFPSASRLQRTLCVLLYALQPVIVGNMIDYNFDNGVTYFFVMLLALLLYGHERWAVAVGIMMVFTKESGVLLYGLTLAGFWLFSIRKDHSLLPHALRHAFRRWWLLLPIVFYVIHELWQKHLGNAVLHENIPPDTIFRAMLSIDFLHERFLLFLTEILLFQFTWFQTMVILCGLALWYWRHDTGRQSTDKKAHALALLVFLYLTGIYTFTRYVPYNNVRYMMPLFPLGILLFTQSGMLLGRGGKMTSALMMIAVFFNGIAMFRSIDPVSARILGTFPFGTHSMYALGKYDGCCLLGRDQLVYNLEYRKLFTLQKRAFDEIHPQETTIMALPPDAVVPVTFRRAAYPQEFTGIYVSIEEIPGMNPLPQEFFFIDLPNLPAEEGKRRVEEFYDPVLSERIEEGGYSIGLMKYVLKPTSALAGKKRS